MKDTKQEGQLYGMMTLVLCNYDSGYIITGIGEKEEQVLLKELAEGRVGWGFGGVLLSKVTQETKIKEVVAKIKKKSGLYKVRSLGFGERSSLPK